MSTYEDPVQDIMDDLKFQYEVQMDCEMWFGLESVPWSHQERCRRMQEFYNELWRTMGGKGEHPVCYKYKVKEGATA